MGKLKLDLNELQVETFDTSPEEEKQARGTVEGHWESGEPEFCTDYTICYQVCPIITSTCSTCGGTTCGGATCSSTCSSTCGSTCGYTCGSTCGSTCGVLCTSPDASCGYPQCP